LMAPRLRNGSARRVPKKLRASVTSRTSVIHKSINPIIFSNSTLAP
jgi:hypothetical protein